MAAKDFLSFIFALSNLYDEIISQTPKNTIEKTEIKKKLKYEYSAFAKNATPGLTFIMYVFWSGIVHIVLVVPTRIQITIYAIDTASGNLFVVCSESEVNIQVLDTTTIGINEYGVAEFGYNKETKRQAIFIPNRTNFNLLLIMISFHFQALNLSHLPGRFFFAKYKTQTLRRKDSVCHMYYTTNEVYIFNALEILTKN